MTIFLLSLGRGEIFGLLGPNGAGKTTLVSQIIGLAKPDSGSITIDDVDIIAKPGFARQACSFQAQTQVPINGLTAMQAIELVGRVRGGNAKNVRAQNKRTAAQSGNGRMDEKIGGDFFRRDAAFGGFLHGGCRARTDCDTG